MTRRPLTRPGDPAQLRSPVVLSRSGVARRAVAATLFLLVLAACSVSSPKLAAGPPVTTGPAEGASTTTSSVPVDGTDPPGTSATGEQATAASGCPTSTKITVASTTKVATTKAG